MICLRDAILRVANYFFTADPNCMPDELDFSLELQVSGYWIVIALIFKTFDESFIFLLFYQLEP